MTDTADAPEAPSAQAGEANTAPAQTETPASTEAATQDAQSTQALSDNAQSVADAVAENAPKDDGKFDFVLDKYKTDGRTDEESAMEQAKAYKELQGKFGAFTGAPEEYEVALSEEMSQRINLDDYKDDPLMVDFKELAKDMGLNNDGFNKVIEMHFKTQLATNQAIETLRDEQLKLLGPQADRRIENIQDWGKFNLDSGAQEQLANALTSAGAVEAFEAIIAKTRNAPQSLDSTPAPSISDMDLAKMQSARDEHGQPKMNNPEYKKKVERLYDQRYGAAPMKSIIG